MAPKPDGPRALAPVPAKSWQAREAHRQRPENPGLLFERYVPSYQAKAESEEWKKGFLQEIVAAAQQVDPELQRAYGERWQAAARACHAQPFTLKTAWRLIVGLGRKGALEVGFTFNRYGLPIIPGSSLKGLAHAYALLVDGRGEKGFEKDADFVAIFGRAPERGEDESVSQAGQALFFDAIPAGVPELEVDIMNPHYPNYYQGEEPPANWQKPNLIHFLTVAQGQPFCFAVGWRGPLDDKTPERLGKAVGWLRQGLATLGAGAKTTAGYGVFELPPDDRLQPRAAAAEAAAPVPTAPPQAPTAPRPSGQRLQGTVLTPAIRSGQQGRVRGADGQEYVYDYAVIEDKGSIPGKKKAVIFEVVGGKVVWLKRA